MGAYRKQNGNRTKQKKLRMNIKKLFTGKTDGRNGVEAILNKEKDNRRNQITLIL